MAKPSKKQAVIDAALAIAAREGLECITIGRLAKLLGMSKSGVIGGFSTKEGLQVAVLKHAAGIFAQEVIQPNGELQPGLGRLKGMLSSWSNYAFGDSLGNGCFFLAAAFEYDGRPGTLKDMIAHVGRSWLGAITGEIHTAIELGELPSNTNPDMLAFEIHGVLLQANWSMQLLGDESAAQKLDITIERLLSNTSRFHAPIK